MNTTLFRNAKAIVTVDGDDRVLLNANLRIKGNAIDYIGYDDIDAEHMIDASELILYPGLINTHHHFYQTFTRNLAQVQNLELFPWLTALYEIWRHLDDECIYYSSLTAMGELVRYGCTTAMDHHYVFPKEGSDPVSYTHLDVYKRQAIPRTRSGESVNSCLLYTSRCV